MFSLLIFLCDFRLVEIFLLSFMELKGLSFFCINMLLSLVLLYTAGTCRSSNAWINNNLNLVL